MTTRTPQMKQSLTLKTAIFATLGIVVIALVSYNMRDRIIGTPLLITTAKDGATVETPFLPIKGVARHARELFINGRAIAVDRTGAFDDEVVLSPGYNIVEVALKDQFGNQKVKTYQIVVASPTAVASVDHTPYQ